MASLPSISMASTSVALPLPLSMSVSLAEEIDGSLLELELELELEFELEFELELEAELVSELELALVLGAPALLVAGTITETSARAVMTVPLDTVHTGHLNPRGFCVRQDTAQLRQMLWRQGRKVGEVCLQPLAPRQSSQSESWSAFPFSMAFSSSRAGISATPAGVRLNSTAASRGVRYLICEAGPLGARAARVCGCVCERESAHACVCVRVCACTRIHDERSRG